MTVTVQTPRDSYIGDAIQDTFAFGFRILRNAAMVVTVDGVTQVEITNYTLDNITALGGDVIFEAGSIPADGSVILLLRDTALDQETDYIPFDAFPAETHETGLDKLTMAMQDMDSRIDNAANDFMGKTGNLLAWDADNLLISNVLDPVDAQDAATKEYVDINIGSGDLNGADNETITGEWRFNAFTEFGSTLRLDNNTVLAGRDIGGTPRALIELDDSDEVQVGNVTSNIRFKGMFYLFPEDDNAGFDGVVRGAWDFQKPPQIEGSLWPTGLGLANQILTTDGAGLLRWSTLSSGGAGADPAADELITGLWTFQQNIQGFTTGNLVASDLDDYAKKVPGPQETIENQWTFDELILGTCQGNVTDVEVSQFTSRNVAELIGGNWEFGGSLKASGGMTIEATGIFSAQLNMNVVAGPQGNIRNSAGTFVISPEGDNATQILFNHADKEWFFMGGASGATPNVMIKDRLATPGGALMSRSINTGFLSTVPNLSDDYNALGDWVVNGNWTFNNTIQGECSNNIGSSSDFTVTGTWDFATAPIVRNNIALEGGLNGDIAQVDLVKVTVSDGIEVGDPSVNMVIDALAFVEVDINSFPVALFVPSANGSLQVLDRGAQVREVGFRKALRRAISTNDATVQSDEDGLIAFTGGVAGQTIDIDQLLNGTGVAITNTSSNPVTLGEGAGVNLDFLDGGGALLPSGDLTLAVNGVAHLYWVTPTSVQCWGNGLS